MADTARELLESMRTGLTTAPAENRFVSAVVDGRAPLAALAALAAEEHHIVPGDRRAFLLLAARATEPASVDFFSTLARGEGVVLPLLPAMAAGAGMTAPELAGYEPRAGCQAYANHVAWLALNADPAEVALALAVNFAAWGGYCATLARALRDRYGWDDGACAFLDFFATPAPELARQAVDAAQAGLDAGRHFPYARRYARLLHDYETLFWNTLADIPA
ncbi:thiaminase II/PqqC family protein [Plantactinospora endophytica]|uniref:Thiaminase-2/PQQC domain-containing protein n=1 Tax=Plantactinospora endophytica TaxID=673535 RepID=A0ABQ4EC58_9ACTN|nr:hypothetical protein [Plantactinospora endophytica]GIG92240.1 hypothetical protein Pen02_71760 [Plantactinospora endophytica]